MFEPTNISDQLTKQEQYETIISQAKSLVEGENNFIANISNLTSLLKYSMNFFWVGIYKVEESELVLGPFQGTVACTRIPKGKGVCGSCWERNKTIIVPNVDEFEGHIACSSLTKSEIVLPIKNKKGEVAFVLDVDSEQMNSFNEEDQKGLEQIVTLIEAML